MNTSYEQRYRIKYTTLLMVLFLLINIVSPVSADSGSHRTKTITIEFTKHLWWLVRESDNLVECELSIDHEGVPTTDDIFQQCWKETHQGWVNEAVCELENVDLSTNCPGFYFHHVGQSLQSKEIDLELPPATVLLITPGCSSISGTFCDEIPKLKIIGEESLPNEKITQIQGLLNNIPFACEGNVCEIQLRETGSRGIPLKFWADSSYGDASVHHSGQIRVIKIDGTDQSSSSGWLVDFIHTSESGDIYRGCSQIWMSFPTPGKPADWLSSPTFPGLLETNDPLLFLSGMLIQEGYVNADQCEYKGLTVDGYATQCGLEQARPDAYFWQNIYNPFIIEVSQKTGIPSQLIKRIIAQESQFWPGVVKHTYLEYGLGQLTMNGVDATLLWNQEFYSEFCPLILAESVCNNGYAQLGDWEKDVLRGVFLTNSIIELPPELEEVDPDDLQTSMTYLSEVITGNCRQVGKMIENQTGKTPGQTVSYEDLWRLTLANYHGGPGCLSEAILEVSSKGNPLIWENIAFELGYVCPYVLDYIDNITR